MRTFTAGAAARQVHERGARSVGARLPLVTAAAAHAVQAGRWHIHCLDELNRDSRDVIARWLQRSLHCCRVLSSFYRFVHRTMVESREILRCELCEKAWLASDAAL